MQCDDECIARRFACSGPPPRPVGSSSCTPGLENKVLMSRGVGSRGCSFQGGLCCCCGGRPRGVSDSSNRAGGDGRPSRSGKANCIIAGQPADTRQRETPKTAQCNPRLQKEAVVGWGVLAKFGSLLPWARPLSPGSRRHCPGLKVGDEGPQATAPLSQGVPQGQSSTNWLDRRAESS